MINLLGVSDNDWRANQGEKETPTIVEDLTVKYYTNDTFESAWLTSPDPRYNSVSKELDMEYGHDAQGNFVTITVPSLEYWDMLYFKQKG